MREPEPLPAPVAASLQPSEPKTKPAKPAVVAGYAGRAFKVSEVW